jgi:putative endonuclease
VTRGAQKQKLQGRLCANSATPAQIALALRHPRPMTVTRLRTGRLAEARAAEHLASVGYEILSRNARTKYGELDLVARDRRALVFVEVKGVRSGSRVGPEKAVLWVTPRKQVQVRRLAAAWLAERREEGSALRYSEIRFDAVGVVLDRRDVVLEIDHVVGAF